MPALRIAATLACLALPACAGVVANPTRAAVRTTAPAAADWTCVGAAVDTSPALTGDSFRVHFRDATSRADLAGVTVAVCGTLDEACTSPLAQTAADDYGLATVAVPGGLASFDGYLQLAGPSMPPNLVFVPGRALDDGVAVDVDVYSDAALDSLAALAGVTLEGAQALSGGSTGLALGVVRLDVADCAGAPASGVSVAVGSQSGPLVTRYFAGDGVPFSADAKTTDATGVAFAFGAAAGAIGVAAKVDGAPVGGARGFARPGAVSSVVVRP